MKHLLNQEWQKSLAQEFDKSYFKHLSSFIATEYDQNIVYPERKNIFRALNLTAPNRVKVVIIGQDPYHGSHQANGLAFAVNEGISFPPSLRNIFKELENDTNSAPPLHGDLLHWSKQGVLLLNATLTVRSGQAGSHQNKGWETFTDEVIRTISRQNKDVIFLLWGGFAKKKAKLIDQSKHHLLMSGHPSPLSANRGYWFGNKHFSKTNDLLQQLNRAPINW
ncbi:uracil-DNA glycosylase [Brumimicrobium salinarum]|uniref:Uracil-DNA glycosylase n=1 Tax=Brumimicrobium salinarum TaxID=2058658 RepID=A0A2I0R4Y4_9FLAO|nr:uracil-DNA glycosylase [Brumimicrobium salinarum]PKR81651.1 uracil-DNA glycosylase [Brumimicrobium salinarum]